METKKPANDGMTIDALNKRIQILEEKFEYQERTIDALNDVIIEQQNHLDTFKDQIDRLQAALTSIDVNPGNEEDPPPPHY